MVLNLKLMDYLPVQTHKPYNNLRPNKKKCLFQGFFFVFLNCEKKFLCILKGISPFKMHEILYFSRKLEKILGFTSKFRQGRVTLSTGIFFIWPNSALLSLLVTTFVIC